MAKEQKKPARQQLADRLWLNYFNNVLWQNHMIDWQTYNKMRLRIRGAASKTNHHRRTQ